MKKKLVGVLVDEKARLGIKYVSVDDEMGTLVKEKIWTAFKKGLIAIKWNPKKKQFETIPSIFELIKRKLV